LDYVKISKKFEAELNIKDAKLTEQINKVESFAKSDSNGLAVWQEKNFLKKSRENAFTILVYEKDSLVFWSNNEAPVSKTFNPNELKDGLVKLENGWYNTKVRKGAKYKTIGLFLIKYNYPFENNFLSNVFHENFGIPSCGYLIKEKKKDSFPITLADGSLFCYLHFDNSVNPSSYNQFSPLWYFILFLFLIFIFSTVCFLDYLTSLLKDHFDNLLVTIVFIVSVFALRILLLWNKFPQIIYDLPAFSPAYYGTSFLFPSIGDFMFNAITLLYISIYIYNNHSAISESRSKNEETQIIWTSSIKILAVLFGSIPISFLFSGLIINSNISYNISNLFELDYLSFIGYISMAGVLFSYYFFGEAAIKKLNGFTKNTLLVIWLSCSLIFVIFTSFFIYEDLWLICWPPIFFGVLLSKKLKPANSYKTQNTNLYPIISLIIVFAAFTSHITSHSYSKKEQDERKVLAEKLAVEFDPVAEYLFADLEKRLLNDKKLIKYLDDTLESKGALKEYIADKHLRGFWEKYDAQITLCKEGDSLIIESESKTMACLTFFDEMIANQGVKTYNDNFYFLDNNNGRISYIAILSFDQASFYIELDLKIIPEERGFPELLLEIEISKHVRDALKVYSYAKYKNSVLMSQSGDFPYSTKLPKTLHNQDYYERTIDGFNHLFYQVDNTTTIVLSKREISSLDPIIRFSYLFAFYCFLSLIFTLFAKFPKNLNPFSFNFRRKIELSMISVLLISLFPISIGTKYYIEKQYHSRNQENIKEKIQSVLIELEHKLADETTLTIELKEYISYLLTKFSYVFFTDINLYDLGGTLIASSQPKIFDEKLISTKMNSDAYLQLSINEKTEFVQQEEIGSFEYLSAYIPFRNQNNEVLAYLNLPYFAKQEEVKKEISNFFIALFNVYAVLILLSIIIALIISNRITQPLRLMQSMLAKIKLGSSNEPIIWNSKDEIGNLIGEYNRMLQELEASAAQLAKSERESAWREMAKQVAHEIKNPLTPMKLSVQHLERSWKDKSPDWDLKLSQFTKTLIQQIDALSSIASEFSNFAKMPKSKRDLVNLLEIAENTIALFQESTVANISLKIESPLLNQKIIVFADNQQLNQVLNNLIKNAIQSISIKKNGTIIVSISLKELNYIVKVEDNGIGISETEQDYIFVPNFTTKTGGMGLGLALIKNMIEDSGGTVWFDSKVGKGSSFYFSLPVHQEEIQ